MSLPVLVYLLPQTERPPLFVLCQMEYTFGRKVDKLGPRKSGLFSEKYRLPESTDLPVVRGTTPSTQCRILSPRKCHIGVVVILFLSRFGYGTTRKPLCRSLWNHLN